MFLDVHILQSVPPANINREESGSPKTAYYGGVRRARVSSQAWKRATRKALEADPAMIAESATRTRLLPQVIGDAVARADARLNENAARIGAAAVAAMFKAKLAERSGGTRTEYLLFLGRDQLKRVTERLLERADELAAADGDESIKEIVGELNLRQLGMTGHAGAIALFGRMVADDPYTNVDAACQVAHAIATHEVNDEFDYYTAVDDEQSDAETGAGMIGTIEFNSATLYRYAAVDLRSLAENLDGDIRRAADLAVAFARTFATCMPTGKRTTFANNTRPDVIVLSVRDDQPVSLVGAFEEPVRAPGGGLMAASAARLATQLVEQDAMYATQPVCTTASYPPGIAPMARGEHSLPVGVPFPEALERIRETVTNSFVEPAV